jgi:Na+-transporting methylmalonyl-CoA/oxaloacetate decarboxylase gamma subunit
MNDFVSQNIITIVAAAVAFEVLMGMLAQAIAERKGHSKRWFWAGFLLSLAGAVWVAGLPDELMRRQLMERREPTERPKAAAPKECRKTEETPKADGAELAAVLAAAVASMGEEEGRRFVMRSFRPAGEGSTAWNRLGRGRPPPARG